MLIVILPADVAQRLEACPDTPNCISTESSGQHSIAPFTFGGTAEDAISRLRAIVESMPRTTIVSATPASISVEFRTLIFRFVDEAFFFADASSGTIRFRSAARTGYSDLGVNRRRAEKIRQLLNETERRIAGR